MIWKKQNTLAKRLGIEHSNFHVKVKVAQKAVVTTCSSFWFGVAQEKNVVRL